MSPSVLRMPMNSADVLAQIERIGELPILPQTLLNIQKIATDDRSSADDLAEAILQDQSLTVRVLRMVNIAMYSRRTHERISTVRRSVIVMGFDTVRKLALGLSVFDMMSKLSRSPHLAEIAQHSLVTAAFAQMLAEISGRIAPEEAFVAALVHDIGKVVLVECSPSEYDAVLSDQSAGVDLIDAERAHFGMSHDRAGRRLAAQWRLPLDLQAVIGDHHDFDALHPPKRIDPLLAIIMYADAMSRFQCDAENRPREMHVLHRGAKALGIAATRMDELYAQVDAEIGALVHNLDIPPGNLREYGQVVNVEGSVTVAPKLTPEQIAERTARQLELYRDLGQGIARGEARDMLLQRVLEGLVEVLGFERAVLLRVDDSQRLLRTWMWAGPGSEELARKLELPLERSTGALALTALQRRNHHVPMARSEAYGELAGEELLAASETVGFATAPVVGLDGVVGVIFADHGPQGRDVVAEEAAELNGLAVQAGLIMSSGVLTAK